ncbi:hypothetical protein BOTBODRAFT_177562 [Botryobasidium botryosum FD-172 SS1]|uniref:Probable 26S proteasome regulatory subunit p27 n=1 Tax=Botryobasidium botryosum (strain FD-172 SS1) TaxID=930990 RepID=A0A067MHN3_BOTB1|nr:hypothetical protein BOTBODRAFT_177562 [Botryobasidium botryosum FD-172 SS1]
MSSQETDETSSQTPQQAALVLMAQKDAIQAEIERNLSILSANASTLHSPLLDPEGFPRADIDIVAVRRARVRIIELRNDLTAIMDKIKIALEAVYQRKEMDGPVNVGQHADAPGQAAEQQKQDVPKPFARVDGVLPQSPASVAGLKREDLIVRFGELTSASFTSGLQPLAAYVTSHENQPMEISVKRGSQNFTLKFTPRSGWGGRGLLGCHVVPV